MHQIIKNQKCRGYDRIPQRILVDCANILVNPWQNSSRKFMSCAWSPSWYTSAFQNGAHKFTVIEWIGGSTSYSSHILLILAPNILFCSHKGPFTWLFLVAPFLLWPDKRNNCIILHECFSNLSYIHNCITFTNKNHKRKKRHVPYPCLI